MNAQQSTTVTTFTQYSAAPDADRFLPVDLDDLREILAELDRVDPTQCPGDLYDIVHDDIELLTDTVIPAAERGVEVLVAQDEDGYYFARRSEPSRTFAGETEMTIFEPIADYERIIIRKLREIAERDDPRAIRSGLTSALGPHAEYDVADRNDSFERLQQRLDSLIVTAWRRGDESTLAIQLAEALRDEARHIELTLSERTITLTPYTGPDDNEPEILPTEA